MTIGQATGAGTGAGTNGQSTGPSGARPGDGPSPERASGAAVGAAKISVVLPVKNVEGIITACLESLRWADEVLLVDGQSKDRTLEIAATFPNTRAIQHPSSDIRVIVQESEPLAAHPWIFWFCADEVCTPELAAEIRDRIQRASAEVTHFMIPSRTRQFGTDWGEGETFPRLWRKGVARFPLKRMHEMPDFTGRAEALAGYYWHVNNPNIRTLLPKFLRYEYVDARSATDAACEQVNPSFFYQLGRFNYYAIRHYWSNRHRGVAATLNALSLGMGQLIRHLMLIDELRIRRGETTRDTHGWG
jgi:(heptosyl)LPS beta-1,4-glucosyltransferase